MDKQKVAPIAGWDEAAAQMESWAISCTVFLDKKPKHPGTFEMFLLIEETPSISL